MDLHRFQQTVDRAAFGIRLGVLSVVVMAVLVAMGPVNLTTNYIPNTKHGETLQRITEDMRGWDCSIMGNHLCGGTTNTQER